MADAQLAVAPDANRCFTLVMVLRVLLSSLLAAVSLVAIAAAADVKIDYSVAYQECNAAFQSDPSDVASVLAKCEESAKQGVPGAQYVMGALLLNRGGEGDVPKGINWLEKAVKLGSPAAGYHLAGFLVAQPSDPARVRGRELFKQAVCAGYPPAVAELGPAGTERESLACPPGKDSDFAGEWLVSMKWDEKSEELVESYRVAIQGTTARVFIKSGDEWIEAKPGKFTFTQLDQSATIAATDSGWDFDGKWIESWTLQFMRTGPDDAAVAYLRTVNNPNLPGHFNWRAFSSFAKGKAHRRQP